MTGVPASADPEDVARKLAAAPDVRRLTAIPAGDAGKGAV